MNGVDPHGYVSVQAVEDMATHIGFLSPTENERLCSELASAYEEISKLEKELDDSNTELDAIEVIRSKGWKPHKKPGRKPKKVEDYEETIA